MTRGSRAIARACSRWRARRCSCWRRSLVIAAASFSPTPVFDLPIGGASLRWYAAVGSLDGFWPALALSLEIAAALDRSSRWSSARSPAIAITRGASAGRRRARRGAGLAADDARPRARRRAAAVLSQRRPRADLSRAAARACRRHAALCRAHDDRGAEPVRLRADRRGAHARLQLSRGARCA